MAKAVNIWKILWDTLEYKFFTGVAHKGFDALYGKMNPKHMHYIPAVNARAALGIASGTSVNKVKSGVFLADTFLNIVVEEYNNFIKSLGISFLVFIYNSSGKKIKAPVGIPLISLSEDDYEKNLVVFDKKIVKHKKLGIIVLEEGIIE